MSLRDFATQFNPFAFQSAPLRSVQFGGQEYEPQPAAQQEIKPLAHVGVERPIVQPTKTELLNEDYDRHFVKKALSYGSEGRSSLHMPVVSADYAYAGDDSDFRGKGTYCIA